MADRQLDGVAVEQLEAAQLATVDLRRERGDVHRAPHEDGTAVDGLDAQLGLAEPLSRRSDRPPPPGR
jgi:hypothetical protein